jgi:hypothetical protein
MIRGGEESVSVFWYFPGVLRGLILVFLVFGEFVVFLRWSDE